MNEKPELNQKMQARTFPPGIYLKQFTDLNILTLECDHCKIL